MFKPENPYSRSEILEATRYTRDDIAEFYGSISPDVFYDRPAGGWSPFQNLRHLSKSVLAVNLGLLQPRFMLRMFFGNPGDTKARRLEDTRDDYLGTLAAGKGAGIYAPWLGRGIPRDALATRDGSIEGWKQTLDAYMRIIEKKWPEDDLDRYRLPHPIMGKIIVREMLMFTLLHVYHHTGIVKQRLETSS